MGDDESLCGIFGARLDAVDEMGEDDLGEGVSKDLLGDHEKGTLTVLPEPVANETPRRLCPCFMAARTDWMQSS